MHPSHAFLLACLSSVAFSAVPVPKPPSVPKVPDPPSVPKVPDPPSVPKSPGEPYIAPGRPYPYPGSPSNPDVIPPQAQLQSNNVKLEERLEVVKKVADVAEEVAKEVVEAFLSQTPTSTYTYNGLATAGGDTCGGLASDAILCSSSRTVVPSTTVEGTCKPHFLSRILRL